jgi:hypothetical protein
LVVSTAAYTGSYCWHWGQGSSFTSGMAETKQPTVDELEKKEEELFRTGPLSVLTTSVKSNSQVLINCRWACVKPFTRCCRSSTLPPCHAVLSFPLSHRLINICHPCAWAIT